MDGSSVTDAALRQDYIERARELVPMLSEAGDEIEKNRADAPSTSSRR